MHRLLIHGRLVHGVAVALAAAVVVLPMSPAAGHAGPAGPLRPISGDSPYAAGCRDTTPGTTYLGAEVEPWAVADPRDPAHLVAAWQQDRRSNGGAQGIAVAVSADGGRSWQPAAAPPFSQCAGGTEANGGGYERASNPWVSIGPDGTVYLIALATNPLDGDSVMLASTSQDGGRTWGPVSTLIDDAGDEALNDKPAVTADPWRPGRAYAVWDRLSGSGTETDPSIGPTYFARTLDGGRTWQPAVPVLDPGPSAQTISSLVQVLGDGTLVLVTDVITPDGVGHMTAMRSTDGGKTWGTPIEIGAMTWAQVKDAASGARVRTADYLLSAAADPRRGKRALYVAWQDSALSSSGQSQILMSSSRNGGLTWSAPARMSPEPGPAFLPQLVVSRLGVPTLSYLDFSRDDAATDALETKVWIRSQLSPGHWSAARAWPGLTIDMRKAPVAGGLFLGDYYGLLSVRGGLALAIPVPAFRPGDPADIVYSKIPWTIR
jgi:hypothetical protein